MTTVQFPLFWRYACSNRSSSKI